MVADMRWVRLPSGDKVHAFVDGETICGVPSTAETMTDVTDPTWQDRCQNCDNQWRRRGRDAKPTRVPIKGNPKVRYAPRFKFKDFDT